MQTAIMVYNCTIPHLPIRIKSLQPAPVPGYQFSFSDFVFILTRKTTCVNQSLFTGGESSARRAQLEKETKTMLRELAYYSSLGISVALAIFIGLFIGLGLDKLFGTSPIFMFIFLAFGIAAGFINIGRAVKRSNRDY